MNASAVPLGRHIGVLAPCRASVRGGPRKLPTWSPLHRTASLPTVPPLSRARVYPSGSGTRCSAVVEQHQSFSSGFETFAVGDVGSALLQTGNVFEVSEGLESPIQLFYLLTLLSILVVGAFLVVRQVLVRNELEETIKVLGERKRRGEATAEDYFELGVVLVRKKLYTQATQNLQSAQKMWDGEPEELAQVHNAMGFSYFNMGKYDIAIDEYTKAVKLQPGYVTAWNNLGDAYEATKKLREALDCYNEVLSYAPDNKVAQARREILDNRIKRRTTGN